MTNNNESLFLDEVTSLSKESILNCLRSMANGDLDDVLEKTNAIKGMFDIILNIKGQDGFK